MILYLFYAFATAEYPAWEDSARLDLILQDLDELRWHPLDLNQADAEQLKRLPFLDPGQAEAIVEYRNRHGRFRAFDDLRQLPGFSRRRIAELRPYVTISTRSLTLDHFSQRIRLRTEPRRENAHELYTATRLQQGDMKLFLVTEKDPYETTYLDYCAAGLLAQRESRTFALGRYDLDLGAGSMLSSMGSFFSTLDYRLISRERGIISYTSTMENGGFFGAAFRDSCRLPFTLFYSNLNRDGLIDADGFARSFDDRGDHVDSASLARRDRINEEIFGYHLRARLAGVQVSHAAYTGAFRPAFVARDSVYEFFGRRFWMAGLHGQYRGKNFLAFSELVRAHQDRIGGIFGLGAAQPPFKLQTAGKYFPRGFFSPKGGEALDGKCIVSVSADYRPGFILLTADADMNQDLRDDSVQYNLTLELEKESDLTSGWFRLRWRWQDRQLVLIGSRAIIRLEPCRPFYLEVRLEDKTDLRPAAPNRGVYSSLELGFEKNQYGIKARVGQFDVDAYACRIIVYEPDLPGVISNRMLYHQGRYGFILAKFKPSAWGEIAVKYSVMDRDSLTHRIGGQVDVKW